MRDMIDSDERGNNALEAWAAKARAARYDERGTLVARPPSSAMDIRPAWLLWATLAQPDADALPDWFIEFGIDAGAIKLDEGKVTPTAKAIGRLMLLTRGEVRAKYSRGWSINDLVRRGHVEITPEGRIVLLDMHLVDVKGTMYLDREADRQLARVLVFDRWGE